MSINNRKVYIIESPSPEDILNGVREGSALNEALNLAQIKSAYFNVVNRHTLIKAFERIAEDINRVDNILGVVDIHFSMHGNQDGIGLTSNEFVTWNQLNEIIRNFNEKVGYMEIDHAPGRKFGAASLNFSVCEGFNAKRMAEYSFESPFTCIIGSQTAVNWSEALVAFTTYYHNAIHKNCGWHECVFRMNMAAGLENVFNVHVAEGLAPTKSAS